MDNEPYMRFLVRSVLLNKDLLKYIVSFQRGKKYYDIIDAHWVIGNGHLSLFKERSRHLDYTSHTQCPMDRAASRGHLEIVKWLHENEDEIMKITGYKVCTSQAMHYAAKYGYFEIVKWLYFTREEGCTQFTLSETVRAGHFEIVKWLHDKYHDFFKTSAYLYRAAITMNRIDIFVWVWENIKHPETCDPLNEAILYGSFEIVKWLCDINKVVIEKYHINTAKTYGFSEIHLYLESKII